MDELKIFNYQEKPIRTIERDGEVWWVLKDVCSALGIVDHISVSRRLEDDEKGVCQILPLSGKGGAQETAIINEPGMYNVILRSDKKDAKNFKRWITHDVLPEIRRTGNYSSKEQKQKYQYPSLPDGVTFSSAVGFMRLTRRVMLDMGANPVDIGMMIKETCETIDFPVPISFAKQIPGQLDLFRLPE